MKDEHNNPTIVLSPPPQGLRHITHVPQSWDVLVIVPDNPDPYGYVWGTWTEVDHTDW